VGVALAADLEKMTGIDCRTTILGHVQRGGTPTAFDRVLATRYGVCAVDMVKNGKFGHMAALRGTEVLPVPLEECIHQQKLVPPQLYDVAKVFFG